MLFERRVELRNARENNMPLRPPFVHGRRKAGFLWQALCVSGTAQAGAWTPQACPDLDADRKRPARHS